MPALVHIELCESCAGWMWPALQVPALNEPQFLSSVAATLATCPICMRQVGKLRNAIRCIRPLQRRRGAR